MSEEYRVVGLFGPPSGRRLRRARLALTIGVGVAVVACGGMTGLDESPASRDAGVYGSGGTGGSGGSTAGATGGTGGGSVTTGTTSKPLCGNGRLDPGEACDSAALTGQTCASLTMNARPFGTLRCKTSCVFDASGCSAPQGAGGFIGTGGFVGAGGFGAAGGFGGSAGFGGNNGGTFGDPHVFTSDGLKYDFQAVGEFILIEDASDPGFVVQVRQERFRSLSTLSVNTAVAARVGASRVSIHAGDGAPVHVNGVAQEFSGALLLRGGGRVEHQDGGYVVTWPTGEQLLVSTAWKELVNVSYVAAKAGPARKLRGLLGTHDGDPSDDLTTRDGVVVAVPPSPDALYDVFGKSYRVKADEALFDYGPGESPAAFQDESFPRSRKTAGADLTLADLVKAQHACLSAGVTGAAALEACAVDVAVTGDTGFAKAAAGGPRRARAVLP
jgi:hypothetical protein